MENVVQNQYLLEARNSSAFVWEFLKSCFFFFFPKRMGAHSFTKCSAICNLSDIDSTKTPTVFQSGTIEVKSKMTKKSYEREYSFIQKL